MKNKRGQLTLFIILGIIVVVTALLIFLFRPKIISTQSFNTENPSAFIHSCLEEKIDSTLNQIYLKGGVLDADHSYLYQGEEVTYLCYTNQYYTPCQVEHPILEYTILRDLENEMRGTVEQCFEDLKSNYERKGYTVNLKEGNIGINLLLDKITFSFPNYELTATKQESHTYNNFEFSKRSDLFNVLQIVNGIILDEVNEGDVDTLKYLNSFQDLKLEKKKQEDGTTVYIITNKDTQNKFQFAVRSDAPSTDPTIRR
jgi:hypothetical protein